MLLGSGKPTLQNFVNMGSCSLVGAGEAIQLVVTDIHCVREKSKPNFFDIFLKLG